MKPKKITISLILMLLIIPILMFPLYVMIIGGFKGNMALTSIPPDLNPLTATLKSYQHVLSKFNLIGWFLNSTIVSTGITVITLIIATCAGFAFSKIRFRGAAIFFSIIIATMILPRQILLVPNYIVALNLHIDDTLFGVIVTSIAAPFGIFLCKQFMSTIPDELMEAATIDGCTTPGIFLKIILPLSKPVIGSLAIFTFIGSWNDYLWQFIMLNTKSKWTMPIAVASFVGMKSSAVAYQMAAASISAIPMIIIFIAFQKFFIKGLTVGAVKG